MAFTIKKKPAAQTVAEPAKKTFSLGKPKPATEPVEGQTSVDVQAELDALASPKQPTALDIIDGILADDAKAIAEREPTEILDKPDSLETDLHYEGQPEEMGETWADKIAAGIAVIKSELEAETMDKIRVSEAMRSVMISMREDPNTVSILANEDKGAMVRALRLTYSTTLATKQNNKSKKKATSQKVDDVVGLLAGLGDLKL